MTAIDDTTLRGALRRELAALVDLDPEVLVDQARLIDDLGLDSLAMMRVVIWLESSGVAISRGRTHPLTVGEALSLLEKTNTPRLSIRVTENAAPVPMLGTPDVQVPMPADPLAPVLRTSALWLNPVQPDDMSFLFTLAAQPETSFRWRYRGVPPSIERFMENVWTGVAVQFVARRTEDNERVGHVMAFGVDTSLRHAHVGAVFIPGIAGTGLAAQAVAIFIRYLFHTFPFLKVYLEIPGYNWPQMQSGEGRLFTVEGVRRRHHYYAGREWDEYICAVYADQFDIDAG
jgi:RimJ/RimL family protein N-acetyltransferase/aryl carrier-like protein